MIKEIKVLSRSMILDYINCAKPNVEKIAVISIFGNLTDINNL